MKPAASKDRGRPAPTGCCQNAVGINVLTCLTPGMRLRLLENVPAQQDLVCKEAFGPVAVLTSFRGFDRALDEVNDSVFGLQAGIFTR